MYVCMYVGSRKKYVSYKSYGVRKITKIIEVKGLQKLQDKRSYWVTEVTK